MTTFARTAATTGLTVVEMLSKWYSRTFVDDGLVSLADSVVMSWGKWRYMDDAGLDTVSDSMHIPWVHQRLVDQGAVVSDYETWVGFTGPLHGAHIWARGQNGYSDIVR